MATDGEGERLDRYELIAELASGGMATVFLARLVGVAGFQRMVAIKRLHPHLAREREFVDMFLDEARLAARIHHPNVVPILEVGESERGYYLVMEYVEGDTAARLFARSAQAGKRVPHDVAVRVVLDSLAGLHAAHELKDDENKPLELVHRDVSPQNILVGIDGTSRITDFGVARAASRLSTTRSGQLKGKLSYMAPEQARGVAIDRRADVFAMGIVLWEALAFKRLFKGEGEAETLNRVLYEPIPTLKSAMPTIPDALDAVVMKALEREPDKRFASASDFAEALEAAARPLRTLASAKDVAACLDSVMGTDLQQQRDAVRAWLARSEPSRSHSKPRPSEVTRVEGSGSGPSRPPEASSASGATLDRASLLEDAKKGARAMGADVSSVSSAVIQVPPPPITQTGVTAARERDARSRGPFVLVGALLALVVVGGAGVGFVKYRSAASPGTTGTTAGATSATTGKTEPSPVVGGGVSSAAQASDTSPSPPQAGASASASAAATVAAAPVTPLNGATTQGRKQTGFGRPLGPATGKPTSTAPPATAPPPGPNVPDDISRNPYR